MADNYYYKLKKLFIIKSYKILLRKTNIGRT